MESQNRKAIISLSTHFAQSIDSLPLLLIGVAYWTQSVINSAPLTPSCHCIVAF